MKQVPMSAEEIAKAGEMLDAGASYCAVGKALGRHECTIAKYFPNRGWKQGNPGLSTETLSRIEGMLDDGASYNEIARTLGITVGTIAKHFPGRGWPLSRGAERRKLNELLKGVKL